MEPIYSNSLTMDTLHGEFAVQVFVAGKRIMYFLGWTVILSHIAIEIIVRHVGVNVAVALLYCKAFLLTVVPYWSAAGCLYHKAHGLIGQTYVSEFYNDFLVYAIRGQRYQLPYSKIKKVYFVNDIIVIIHRDMLVLDRTQFSESSEKAFRDFLHEKNLSSRIYVGELNYNFRKALRYCVFASAIFAIILCLLIHF